MFFNFLNFLANFLRIFLPGSGMKGIWDQIFFFLFLGLCQPGLDINNARMMFLNFFCYFLFWNFLARVKQEWNSEQKFLSLFLSLSQPGLDRNNATMKFFNCLNFFAIFLEFSSLGRVGTEFGTNIFFFLFLGLSKPGLDRNIAGMMFYNFLNFFAFFFLNFLAWVGQEQNSRRKFFSLFLDLSQPGFDRNYSIIKFFNLLNFLAIFLEFSSPGWVGTEFGSKFFFSPSRPISTWFGQKYCQKDVF